MIRIDRALFMLSVIGAMMIDRNQAVQAGEFPGTAMINFASYENCILLQNEHSRVVLGPHCGGRVLEFSWNGENALYLNPEHDGWVYTPGERRIGPSGGRFDIGPERIILSHPDLWLGKWVGEITGPRSAQMTSVEDEATGTQLIRRFELDEDTSRLTCTQIIRNISENTVSWCHWSRTFAPGGGICLIPLSGESRFPNQYIMYGPGPVMNYRPEDPNIRIRDGFLEILGTPKHPKLGMDSTAGWFCYLMSNDLMFVKQFPTYPDRVYREMAGLTLSIWYFKEQMCELEPIGPRESILPSESTSFTETWWLLPHSFPDSGEEVDLESVMNLIQNEVLETGRM